MNDSIQHKVDQFKQLLKDSHYPVILSGAGMSTESGLPDFRSATKGMWKGVDPLSLASVDALVNSRENFIKFYTKRIQDIKGVHPNRGHKVLAKLENIGKVKCIITQNVDGFHHTAGSMNVAELHGSLRHCHCHACKREYSNDQFLAGVYQCSCGGSIRPSVVLFGEYLPEEAMDVAQMESEKADLFIVLGSSLSVSPANLFPQVAKENGAKLVIINIERTELDFLADLVIHDLKIGELFQEIDKQF